MTDKISKLKAIIVQSKMDLFRLHVPKGCCPYSYYKPFDGIAIDCNIGCERCREIFMREAEKVIKEKVDRL